jgi:ubiquinone/menaquinone biosynthesis C-methylase UbiE
MSIRTSIDLKLDPAAAFNAFADDLTSALRRLGIELQPRVDGRVTVGQVEVGHVVRWQPSEEIFLEWLGEDWQPTKIATIRLRFERIQDGTCVTLEREDPDNLFGDPSEELAGWFASEVAAPIFYAMTPLRLGDWITDRRARRPSGSQSRQIYRDPLYHRPNFRAILEVLRLAPDDYLLEVGCGGGAFLKDALASGCRAAAIDHSGDMVRLSREVNSAAIQEKRLEIRQAQADALPFPDDTFTCAVMTGVFGFIPDPLKALHEVWRVLMPGGRFVLFTGSKELRGTPAAPEPIASRLHFYEDRQLLDLAREAGFEKAQIDQPDFEAFAREAGVQEEFLGLFKGRGGGQLLVAQKN